MYKYKAADLNESASQGLLKPSKDNLDIFQMSQLRVSSNNPSQLLENFCAIYVRWLFDEMIIIENWRYSISLI
jgi:hypothetical protein